MPLTRGRLVGRAAVGVLILDAERKSARPMSNQRRRYGRTSGAQGHDARRSAGSFLEHRDHIERIASEILDASDRRPGTVVRIFAKHVI
jgi:hypothetical protein